MSIQPKRGKIPASAGFRRRVILELTVEELPLLDVARERHGTIRQGVLEALRAAAEPEDLQAQTANAETSGRAAKVEDPKALVRERKKVAKLERELQDAIEAVAASQRQAAAAGEGERRAQRLETDLESVQAALEDREAEIELLQDCAVDHLYCARCDQLVPPDEWAWRHTDEGQLAYHESCGDHGPGILGAASWLAHRAE